MRFLFASAVFLVACQQANPQMSQQAQNVRNFSLGAPQPNPALGEALAPQELELTRKIEDVIMLGLKQAPSTPQTRDVHAKHHGCVKAFLDVNPQALPAAQRVGVFAKAQRFPAWVRFSNGNGKPKADIEGDVRGMAVKLMGVPGAKLLESERDAQTQDFLMINSERFFIRDLDDYASFISATNAGGTALAGFAITHPKVMYQIYQLFNQKMANPLETNFFSSTPYQLGNTAIKYHARPCRSGVTPMPQNPGPHYLRENMANSLRQAEHCFDFMVQLRTRPASMPIEDSTQAWESPWLQVARLNIPAQSFDSPAQMAYCENMSFTPWHSLPEHRPLGAVNRVRKTVYDLVSAYRHGRNGVARQEPTGHMNF